MKYKLLTEEQILISIDRLTRFKQTKEKYLRVFKDIVISNLLDPKLKKTEIEKIPIFQLRDWATEIINESIKKYVGKVLENYSINERLSEYEKSVFVCDDETNMLLDNKINYMALIQLVDDNSPVNLHWLKSFTCFIDLKQSREQNCLKFPIEKVLLVEGLTEEILLPAFSKFLGYDFYKNGIQVIPAGGKNQVVKMYYKLSGELKIPIFMLLDKDAEENIQQILPKKRSSDYIHLISCGEFEDLLPKTLIVKTVNKHLSNFASITDSDLVDEYGEVTNLQNIFKEKGLHEFKKAEFAKLVRENISGECDVSTEINQIIQELKTKC